MQAAILKTSCSCTTNLVCIRRKDYKTQRCLPPIPLPILPPPSPTLLRDENNLTSKSNSAKQLLALSSASIEPEQICPSHWFSCRTWQLPKDSELIIPITNGKMSMFIFTAVVWKQLTVGVLEPAAEFATKLGLSVLQWMFSIHFRVDELSHYCHCDHFPDPISVGNVVKRLSTISLG